MKLKVVFPVPPLEPDTTHISTVTRRSLKATVLFRNDLAVDLLERLYLAGDLSLEELIDLLYNKSIFRRYIYALAIYFRKKINYL